MNSANQNLVMTQLALIKDAKKHDVLGKLARYEASLAICGDPYVKPTPFNSIFGFSRKQ